MELNWMRVSTAILLAGYVFVFIFLRRLNEWHYAFKLGKKKYSSLPPGDMGWPFLGNIIPFIRAWSSNNDPNSLVHNLVSKHGRTGIYKTHLFGYPSMIVCLPDMCRRVLTDDVNFKFGYPKSSTQLFQVKSFDGLSAEEHKRFRRLYTSPIVGHYALAVYVERIEDIIVSSLEDWASMKHPVEILKEVNKISFKVIVHIFIGSENQSIITKIGNIFTDMLGGLFSLQINVPGFAYNKALKARDKLLRILEPVVEERKRRIMESGASEEKKDIMDILLQAKEEETGETLKNEDIIDLLALLLFAGKETTAVGMMWSLIYLTEHPEILKKAKEEQEEIIKKRPASQKRLNIQEVKQMGYLAKVIDEILRRVSIAFPSFREATADVEINGYIIPKGWKVLVWARAFHLDSEYYTNPFEFNPSRWEGNNVKAGTFLPFGAGMKHCPGSDLAKLEMSIFLHYFLLNYKMERVNPDCPVTYFPNIRPTDDCLAKIIRVS